MEAGRGCSIVLKLEDALAVSDCAFKIAAAHESARHNHGRRIRRSGLLGDGPAPLEVQLIEQFGIDQKCVAKLKSILLESGAEGLRGKA